MKKLKGTKGFLLFIIVLIILSAVLTPIVTYFSNKILEEPLTISIILETAVYFIFALYTAYVLLTKKENAILITKIFFVYYIIYSFLGIFMDGPSNGITGLAYGALAFIYINTSERVKNTYKIVKARKKDIIVLTTILLAIYGIVFLVSIVEVYNEDSYTVYLEDEFGNTFNAELYYDNKLIDSSIWGVALIPKNLNLSNVILKGTHNGEKFEETYDEGKHELYYSPIFEELEYTYILNFSELTSQS
jgi:hypothetical protein